MDCCVVCWLIDYSEIARGDELIEYFRDPAALEWQDSRAAERKNILDQFDHQDENVKVEQMYDRTDEGCRDAIKSATKNARREM